VGAAAIYSQWIDFMAFFRLSGWPVLQVVLVGVLGLGVLACGSEDKTAEGVTVVEPRLVETPNGERAFTGILVNRQSSTLSIVQIEVALYDDQGAPVETIQIDVRDVPAQDSVSFSHSIDSDQAFRQAQVQSILTP
jgi:hypothetical protein